MKVQNWWIKAGLLTSGADPTSELSFASRQFPDEYAPMIFMTGDGHRSPPFKWTNRGSWGKFFQEVAQANEICCYVETYSDAVTLESVPVELATSFHNGKVFGWEPEVYKIIQNILESILDMISNMRPAQALSDIRHITKEMWRVHDHGYLQPEGNDAMLFWDKARTSGKDPVPVTSLPGFMPFLREYNINAMKLRTEINNVIGANIQKIINQYPDHMHLITCGDAHIINNPLYLYVQPPIGTFGIVDQNSM